MNFDALHSLLVKLAIVFLAITLLPLAIVSFFSVQTANRLIERIVVNQLRNVVAEKQRLLERWLAERRADVEVLAGSSILRGMQPPAIAEYLNRVQAEYRVYRRFVVADPRGKTVYDSLGKAEEAGPRRWHAVAREKRRHMSEVRLEAEGRESAFDLAAPVLDARGELLGAVCATVSTAPILEGTLSVSLGETGECYLVDDAGTFLAHREPDRILRESIAHSESFTGAAAGDEGKRIYTDYRGIRVLGASRRVPGTGWSIVVEQDYDEAFAPARRLLWSIGAVIVLTALGAVAVSLVLAYSIAAPIRKLSASAQAMARGEFDDAMIEPLVKRRDEIGMLCGAFAHMAGQLHSRQDRLESHVGRQEAELREADQRLQTTMKAAARSEHLAALGRLAAGVAHEIRTPLASLKLYLQSVHDEITISPEFTEDFQIAMRQVSRMEATINHFLNFARPGEPAFAEVNPARLVEDALVVVRPRANHQDVEVRAAFREPVPKVWGDFRQLGEALVNLLVNALEAMPRGGRLEISAGPHEAGGDAGGGPWCQVDVSDNGPGIDEADVARMFEPFFTTKASGSGLGLTIVRNTIQRHRGVLRVRSAPGQGATFSIFLPPGEPR